MSAGFIIPGLKSSILPVSRILLKILCRYPMYGAKHSMHKKGIVAQNNELMQITKESMHKTKEN